MANINSKLNLNRTPNIVQPNSLVFAKNIRLDVDNTIHKDYSIFPLSFKSSTTSSDTARTDYINIIIRALHEFMSDKNTFEDGDYRIDYYTYFIGVLNRIIALINGDTTGSYNYGIVGTIADVNGFYMFINCTDSSDDVVSNDSFIIYYDEDEDTIKPCNCKWSYNGGKIDGCVVNNLLGETLLCVAETNETGNLTPLKCINLSKSNYDDNESIYTQTPDIPITNLGYNGTFSYVIPNGVYQFFVRYKIRDNFYTNWFPASKEFFAGNSHNTITNFGTLRYCDINDDSDSSFVFNVTHLIDANKSYYKCFQIGFICSHDDSVVARAWKHFDFEQNIIKFDYKAEDSEEIEVTDLTKSTYQIYNVGNVTSFKNKLYISNYTETDFNENLQEKANEITISIGEEESNAGYAGYPVETTPIGTKEYITTFIDGENNVDITGENGVIHKALTTAKSGSTYNIKEALDAAINTNRNVINYGTGLAYGIEARTATSTLSDAQKQVTTFWNNYDNVVKGPTFTTVPLYYLVNGVKVSATDGIDGIISQIYNTVKYLDENAILLDANLKTSTSFKITIVRSYTIVLNEYYVSPVTDVDGEISKYKVDDSGSDNVVRPDDVSDVDTAPGGTYVNTEYVYNYEQYIYVTLSASISKLETSNIERIKDYTTLIPYQKYKFYVHYVKEGGEITNGYYCGGDGAGEIEAPYKSICDSIIYPIFDNITIPDGYVACFFSIFHSAVNSSTIYNVKKTTTDGSSVIAVEASCLEMNTRLIPANKNITCKQDDNSYVGTYYYSGDASVLRYFGADGVLNIEDDGTIVANSLAFAINDYESQQDIDVQLIKCTPYINTSSYSNYVDYNLLGYVCMITPLDRDRCIGYYSDGSTVYKKNYDYALEEDYNNFISIKELGAYTDSTYKISEFGLVRTNTVPIYSNYNFNYINLSEEPKITPKSYYDYASDDTQTSGSEHTQTVMWRLLTSLTLADTYELASMYKTYTRKTYSPYNEESYIRFENTVRSSELNGDESSIDLFRFDADDYYNVPTNRGQIVNLVAIGDAILVHTRDSMFRFTGSNSLQSSQGEIVQTESQPFDTGVSEMFGSEFGFAGLQYKDDHIITENGYIFFDRKAGVIYIYSGNNQITKISDDIEKLLRRKTITDIHFANDYYNNRFFISILFSDSNAVTLSYSTLEGVKSFVSLHDFYFKEAFNTKTKCYFLTDDKQDICGIDKNSVGFYYKMSFVDGLYPSKISTYLFTVYNYVTNITNSQFRVNQYHSIVDIIDNTNYETIKTLNAITWYSNAGSQDFKAFDEETLSTFNMAESTNSSIPTHYIRIYTDTCLSDLITCMSRLSNNQSLSSVNSYKYPRYNQGKYTLNYFRNIQNTDDIYGYLDVYDDGRNSQSKKPDYLSDNNSLIEGKYFVVRFIFMTNFKLETLSLNYTNKL